MTAIAVAVAADTIGADVDQKWGPFRIALVVLGGGWLAGVAGVSAIETLDRRLLRRRASGIHPPVGLESRSAPPPLEVAGDEPAAKPLRSGIRTPAGSIGVGVLLLSLELLYVWFVSVGRMADWPTTTHYYSLLSEAFLHGRIDLLIDPPPQLAEVDNPYDPNQRAGISVLGDAAYFQGRYYLYWGPVPAVVAAIWTGATGRPVGDHHIAFAAVSLCLLFSTLILLSLRRSFFPSLPAWLLASGVIAVGMAHPLLWNISGAWIYEAAITSGQAFLLAGVTLALPALRGADTSVPRLALAGTAWGLAIGSRLTLLPAVGGLTLLTTLAMVKARPLRISWSQHRLSLVPLGIPVALTLCLLALYNYARFGNALEVGQRYTMTSEDYRRLFDAGEYFSLRYLVPNLLYYSLTPLRARSVFPFLLPVRDDLPSFEMFLRRWSPPPGPHSVEDMTSLLLAVPVIVFAGYLVARLVCGRSVEDSAGGTAGAARPILAAPGAGRTGAWFLLAAALAAGPVLLYFFAANRFAFDFSPLLVLSSVIGMWDLHQRSRGRPVRGAFVTVVIVLAVAATAIVGFLLAVSGPASRFDDYNPQLWHALTTYLSW